MLTTLSILPHSLREFTSGIAKEGVVLIDKPKGWTSFDVIRRLRKLTGIKKIGHAGTLDPMATGLLICCIGRAYTKQISYFQDLIKVYEGSLQLGATTPCYDAMMPEENHKDWQGITVDQLDNARKHFIGKIMQAPPIYSAIKQGGQRAYTLARAGKKVELPPRAVSIYQFDFTDCSLPTISFRVVCSKGTYIRSLAHDFGQFLDIGGYLIALKRVAIGPYTLESSCHLPLN